MLGLIAQGGRTLELVRAITTAKNLRWGMEMVGGQFDTVDNCQIVLVSVLVSNSPRCQIIRFQIVRRQIFWCQIFWR